MARTRGSAKTIDRQREDVRNNQSGNRVASFNGILKHFDFTEPLSTSSSDPLTPMPANDPTPTASTTRKRRIDDADVKSAEKPTKRSSTKKSRQSSNSSKSSKYAPPTKYAHLNPLTDILEPNLIAIFVGFNPGVQTATAGHAYAHPSNHFWRLLHSSGLTDRRLAPAEDGTLPARYQLGNTNLVSRPTRDTAELSRDEQLASVPILEAKIRRFKPEAVCIVGKSIWENIWHYHKGKRPSKAEFKYGWQDESHNMGLVECEDDTDEDRAWKGARVFATTSTSGLSASLKMAEKEAIWRPFGEWVQQRRDERKREQTE